MYIEIFSSIKRINTRPQKIILPDKLSPISPDKTSPIFNFKRPRLDINYAVMNENGLDENMMEISSLDDEEVMESNESSSYQKSSPYEWMKPVIEEMLYA